MPWNNNISLTWQMFGYISWGEGIWQQLLFSETLEPETEVFHFPSSLLFPILFEPAVLVSGMMSSCFAKGPHTPQRIINTIHVFVSQQYFFFLVLLHIIVFIFECVWIWYLSFFPLNKRVKSVFTPTHSLTRWSHISKRWIHGVLSSLHLAACGGFRILL